MSRVKRSVIFICSFLIILFGVLEITLYFFGETAEAQIYYSDKVFNLGFTINELHYNFKDINNSIFDGRVLYSGNINNGFVNIKYFLNYPSYNRVDSIELLIKSILWIILGGVFFLFNFLYRKNITKGEIDSTFDEISNLKKVPINNNFVVIVSVLLVFLLVVISFESIEFNVKPKELISSDVLYNVDGNISNNSMIVKSNIEYFYLNKSDRYKIYKINKDGEKSKFIDDSANYLSIKDDWLYYSNYTDEDKIYKVKTNSTKKIMINKVKSSYLNLVGNYIFYSNGNDNDKLYRIRVDGKEENKINNDESSYLNYYNNWIYYINKSDKNSIYKIKSNGSKRQKILGKSCEKIILYDNYIYYTMSYGKKNINRVSINGEDQESVVDFPVKYFNISSKGIWFSNIDDGGALYFKNTNGEYSKKNDFDSWYINILDDKCFYFGDINNGEIFYE